MTLTVTGELILLFILGMMLGAVIGFMVGHVQEINEERKGR